MGTAQSNPCANTGTPQSTRQADVAHGYEESLRKAVAHIQKANKVMVLSGAGMSTAAGIPDFRSAGGLYGTSSALLEKFTYLGSQQSQRSQVLTLESDVKSALTYDFLKTNPLPYHEMRRGMIIGLGENQWKPTVGHVFPEILNRRNKLFVLASQNIDGLDHKVVSDKSKLYNPHGLMSWLVSEPLDDPICTNVNDPIYQKYVELVKANVKDIYKDRPKRQGRSSHLWPGPDQSTPITLEMFGDVLPAKFYKARENEIANQKYSVKPGSVLFDRTLWQINAAGEPFNAFDRVRDCDMLLVMGTSLSGLTIDGCAYRAGRDNKPLVVFDMTDAPVQSCKKHGAWDATRDSLLQGSIDKSIFYILVELGWFEDIFDFLHILCIGSLRALKEFVQTREDFADKVDIIDQAIDTEVDREKQFYGDE